MVKHTSYTNIQMCRKKIRSKKLV